MTRQTRQTRQSQKKTKAEQIDIIIRLLHAGRTQSEVALAAGVNIRTIQRWITDPEVKARLAELQEQTDAIVKSDPVVLTVTDIRSQVEQILEYRRSQCDFAQQMGLVVSKATAVALVAVEKLDPEEINGRNLPQLLRAIADVFEKTSNAWIRTSGLDSLLEQLDGSNVVGLGKAKD
jgi:hypothetical protein